MSRTIYGCVNFPSGEIVFENAACDDGNYAGCIVQEGAHAQQVAVTISDGCSDGTYYGCVNWATGKFQVIVPDCGYRVSMSNFVDCYPCVSSASSSFWASGAADILNNQTFVLCHPSNQYVFDCATERHYFRYCIGCSGCHDYEAHYISMTISLTFPSAGCVRVTIDVSTESGTNYVFRGQGSLGDTLYNEIPGCFWSHAGVLDMTMCGSSGEVIVTSPHT